MNPFPNKINCRDKCLIRFRENVEARYISNYNVIIVVIIPINRRLITTFSYLHEYIIRRIIEKYYTVDIVGNLIPYCAINLLIPTL